MKTKRGVILVLLFVLFTGITIVSADPTFISPTPSNGYTTTVQTASINVSIPEPSLQNFTYTWNGTNVTLFDNTTLLFMSFNNFSSIGENNSAAVDVSLYGRNGSVNSSIFNATGKYQGAYVFNGLDTSIKTNSSLLNGLSTFTLSGWLFARSTGSRIGFFGQNDAIEFGFIDANTITLWTANGGQVAWTINSTIFPQNAWNHIVVVGTNSSSPYLTMYINGVSQATGGSAATTFGNSGYNFSIGGNGIWDPTGNNFTGMIDEVMVLNRSLTAQEVYILYASNLFKFNQTQWYYAITQNYNATDVLPYGTYTYQATSKNTTTSLSSEIRTLIIALTTPPVPEWSSLGFLFIMIITIMGYFSLRVDQ